MDQTELRARLERLADLSAPPSRDPGELSATVASRHRAQRRRQWALATVATVAAVLVAVLGVPLLMSRTIHDPSPAGPPHSSAVYTGPTRGDLSDDPDFVEGVRRLPWTGSSVTGEVREPPVDTRHVVYAGIVPGARWALVAGVNLAAVPADRGVDRADLDTMGSVAIAWFTGPSDATAEEMSLSSEPRIAGADLPTALSDSATGVTVIVGAPGDRILVSRLVRVDADGTQTRHFTPEYAPQGIAVATGAPVEASLDRVLTYRVIRGGSRVISGRPDAYPNPDFIPPDINIAQLRPAPSPAAGSPVLDVGVAEVLSRTGVSARGLAFTEVWAGELPTRDGGSARFGLLAVEFAGGGLYVLGGVGGDAGSGFAPQACGSETRPAGTPLEEQVFVVRCDNNGGRGPEWANSLVVVAPPGTASAQVLNEHGESVGRYPLTDGVAVVPLPADLFTVEVLGSDGTVVYDRPPMGHAPLGD
jgi:hypothetical protein